MMRVVPYLDLWLLAADPDETADWIAGQALAQGSLSVVSHINAKNYYWLQRTPALREALVRESTLLLDGIGLRIGGAILGHFDLPDLNGTDLFPLVMQRVRSQDLRVFLLGARREIVERAARSIETAYPGVRVVGIQDGYFQEDEEPRVIDHIQASRPQMLLIGLGFLRQERFALRYRQRLQVPLIWNVGGLFDFVSGAKPRAPSPLRKLKLEWLYRFLREPRAMWHRNLVAAPWFLRHVIRARIRSVVRQHATTIPQPLRWRLPPREQRVDVSRGLESWSRDEVRRPLGVAETTDVHT
jgi:N-acetylglucosaminyldiphosphoundecaprenol N-acetyl-beta-D-mannosaminyltransferase